jgi:hypothetical protein
MANVDVDMELCEAELNKCNCNASVEYEEFVNAFLVHHNPSALNEIIETMKENGKSTLLIEQHLKNREYFNLNR